MKTTTQTQKTFSVEFVIAGTRQLRSGTITAASEQKVANYIQANYGHADYLKIGQL